MTPESAAAFIILVLTYVGVAAGRIPGCGSIARGSPSSAVRR
jgi:hypothetical protein